MIVSHAHRFVFLKTRKTAGTSIELSLCRVCEDGDVITRLNPVDEAVRTELGLRGPQNITAPPLRRRVFNHVPAPKVRRAIGAEAFDSYFTFSVERNPWDACVSAYFWTFRDREAPPFAEWIQTEQVEKLARNAEIYSIDGRVVADRVLRFEHLAADFAEVWAHLGLPGDPALPHAKSGSRPPRSPYTEMYDDAGRERVARLFERAIGLMGYEF